MRHLVWSSLALTVALAGGCGDSSEETADPAEIVYPDSLCDSKGCVSNADDEGVCDPDASDPKVTDCNAWRADGTFSLQAVAIDQSAKRGLPKPPSHGDGDLCPVGTVTVEGKDKQCCERVSKRSAKPAFRMTGLQMTKPPLFDLEQVSTASQLAIEEDRYNWIFQLSSDEPGPVMITTGVGLQNTDGSFAFAEGPFELGGQTWNSEGQWDPRVVPAVLGEDGSLQYMRQDVARGDFLVPLWDKKYEFTMLELPLNGVELSTKLDGDLLCAGYLSGNRTFDQPGKIKAYLPLASLRDAHLVFEKGEHGTGLCPLTANVTPADCEDRTVAEWGK